MPAAEIGCTYQFQIEQNKKQNETKQKKKDLDLVSSKLLRPPVSLTSFVELAVKSHEDRSIISDMGTVIWKTRKTNVSKM